MLPFLGATAPLSARKGEKKGPPINLLVGEGWAWFPPQPHGERGERSALSTERERRVLPLEGRKVSALRLEGGEGKTSPCLHIL